ncbi:hypothetical protein Thein_2109 [Thermodesulfatator indicus DSM 15286]|uniref:Uncharacterized protein n=1 Tax=Thermodesulfatator indicus (strain DSM 15286 / JCM 11887 / CIR29812) TaxID=667014 RepID=F8ADE2_THEID|nr:DUF5395 family protein [Thermodesulfatator indicus]AEH45957.1 hypothetical protein Thein_2109 [Thermodesulfatator indicus DSM 15286]
MKITLYYETEWIAKGKGVYVTASSLLELKDKIRTYLLAKQELEVKKVTLVFDRARIPHWIVSHLSVETTELELV